LEKFIGGGKTTIVYVDIGLSCKIYFILGVLHPFSSLSFERLKRASKRL